jgi:UDP-2-acetamido-2,6-beta-L-arabino-hexul-4-ose reductase
VRILLTGASGFIGKNLQIFLRSTPDIHVEILKHHEDPADKISSKSFFDLIIHLAGVNRSQHPEDFENGNLRFTKKILEYARLQDVPPSIIFTSSTQVLSNSDYGKSKLACERELEVYSSATKKSVDILRIPNVYGKWARPNHNSVVATFASLLHNDLKPTFFNEHEAIDFIYIDDLCTELVKKILDGQHVINLTQFITPLTAYEIHSKFLKFIEFSKSSQLPIISDLLDKKLFATFQSYKPAEMWQNRIKVLEDKRGNFSEIIHIGDYNQFSLLRIKPGQTRGEHFHNTKMERFIIISGDVDIHFREIHSGDRKTIEIRGNIWKSVDAIPGWWHSLENIGKEDADVLVWANERFYPNAPDTYRWEW